MKQGSTRLRRGATDRPVTGAESPYTATSGARPKVRIIFALLAAAIIASVLLSRAMLSRPDPPSSLAVKGVYVKGANGEFSVGSLNSYFWLPDLTFIYLDPQGRSSQLYPTYYVRGDETRQRASSRPLKECFYVFPLIDLRPICDLPEAEYAVWTAASLNTQGSSILYLSKSLRGMTVAADSTVGAPRHVEWDNCTLNGNSPLLSVPMWMPDGHRWVCMEAGINGGPNSIWLGDINAPKALTSMHFTGNIGNSMLGFLPDGRALTVDRVYSNYNDLVWLGVTPGGNSVNLFAIDPLCIRAPIKETVQLPDGESMAEMCLSPDGASVAWLLGNPGNNTLGDWVLKLLRVRRPKPRPESSIWISKSDGSDMRRALTIPRRDGSSGIDFPRAIHWLPRSADISYSYYGDIYVAHVGHANSDR